MLELWGNNCSDLEIVQDEEHRENRQYHRQNGADCTDHSFHSSTIRERRQSDYEQQSEQRYEQDVAQLADGPETPALVAQPKWQELCCKVKERNDDQKCGQNVPGASQWLVCFHAAREVGVPANILPAYGLYNK